MGWWLLKFQKEHLKTHRIARQGSHEFLVTGVQGKAVESVASAGQPFTGRTGSIEEAGVGNEAVPKSVRVLNFIAYKHFKIDDPSKPEERRAIFMYSNLLTGHSAPMGQTYNIVILQNGQNQSRCYFS